MAERLIAVLTIVLLMPLTACNGECHLGPPELDAELPTSEDLTADIFLDATLSMQGFVSAGADSAYVLALPRLESATLTGWTGSKVTFHRFGNDRVDPIDRERFLEASRPAFYNDPQYRARTRIDHVIARASPDRLAVIVTDLFQENADVNALTAELKNRYVMTGHAVGLVAIKSAFRGNIYDIGVNRLSYYYRGERPFYILVLGHHRDVDRYIGQLQPGRRQGEHVTILSPHLVDCLQSCKEASIGEVHKLVQDLLVDGGNDERVKQFKVQGEPGSAYFKLDGIRLAWLRHGILTAGALSAVEDLDKEILAGRYECSNSTAREQNTNAGPKEPGPRLAPDAQAVRGVTLDITLDSSDSVQPKLDLQFNVNPAALSPGIYRFDVVLRPRTDFYNRLPAWLDEWNLEQADIENWVRGKARLNAASTLNLKPFVENLWRTVVQVHRPSVLKLYCYIKKN